MSVRVLSESPNVACKLSVGATFEPCYTPLMMATLRRWKPAQLLWIVGIANIVITLAVLTLAILSWHLPENQRLPWQIKIPALLAIFLSVAMSLIAESALQRGIRSHTWPDSLLTAPRRLLSHPTLVIVMTAMIAGSVILFIVLPLNSSVLGTLFLALPLTFSRISSTLNPSSPETLSRSSMGSALYPAKPIQSDQWGR